jgi:FkbM family methyltransferase
MWLDIVRARFGRTITIRRDHRAIRLASRHAVYADDMRRYFDYYHNAVEPAIQHGVSVVDYSRPACHTLRPSGRSLYFTALPEPDDTTDLYLRFAQLQPGDLVLDLGAYCGGAAMAFAAEVGPAGCVVAFEPDPANAAALRENLRVHEIRNVVVSDVGLWSTTGHQHFAAEGNMGSAVASVLARRARTTPVSVISLADAIRLAQHQSGLERVAFVKMDIEGAEVPVLETGRSVLAAHRPRVVVEPHHTRGGQLNTGEVGRLLKSAGFRVEVRPGVESHPMVFAEPP